MSMKIGIFGAGSIGCYVGGRLAASGTHVVLLGRERLRAVIAKTGLRLTHYELPEVNTAQVDFHTNSKALSGCDVIIVTVKSQDTDAAGTQLASVAKPGAVIISLQNGIGNEAVLAARLPEHQCLAAMVPNNVVNLGGGHFHLGTEGSIVLQDTKLMRNLAQRMNAAGIAAHVKTDMRAVQWGKLMLNLNNPINALSGRPLVQQLGDRNNRLVLAACITETLAVLKAAKITPAQVGKVGPDKLAKILRLPNCLYRIILKSKLKIDANARSSMCEDLTEGRASEIDYISGAVVKLGRELNVPTPYNNAVLALTHDAFAKGGSPEYDGKTLRGLCVAGLHP